MYHIWLNLSWRHMDQPSEQVWPSTLQWLAPTPYRWYPHCRGLIGHFTPISSHFTPLTTRQVLCLGWRSFWCPAVWRSPLVIAPAPSARPGSCGLQRCCWGSRSLPWRGFPRETWLQRTARTGMGSPATKIDDQNAGYSDRQQFSFGETLKRGCTRGIHNDSTQIGVYYCEYSCLAWFTIPLHGWEFGPASCLELIMPWYHRNWDNPWSCFSSLLTAGLQRVIN